MHVASYAMVDLSAELIKKKKKNENGVEISKFFKLFTVNSEIKDMF